MPLLNGKGNAIRSANIRELRSAGKPEAQAVAIAYSKERESGGHKARRAMKARLGRSPRRPKMPKMPDIEGDE